MTHNMIVLTRLSDAVRFYPPVYFAT